MTREKENDSELIKPEQIDRDERDEPRVDDELEQVFDRLDKKDNNLQKLVDKVERERDEHLEPRDEIHSTKE